MKSSPKRTTTAANSSGFFGEKTGHMCPVVLRNSDDFANPVCSSDFSLFVEKCEELCGVAVLREDVLGKFELALEVITVEESDWILANQIKSAPVRPSVSCTP